ASRDNSPCRARRRHQLHRYLNRLRTERGGHRALHREPALRVLPGEQMRLCGRRDPGAARPAEPARLHARQHRRGCRTESGPNEDGSPRRGPVPRLSVQTDAGGARRPRGVTVAQAGGQGAVHLHPPGHGHEHRGNDQPGPSPRQHRCLATRAAHTGAVYRGQTSPRCRGLHTVGDMQPQRSGPFPYVPINRRPRITWPNGARLALWVIPNVETFPLNEPVPGGTGLAPDVINWAPRDYGNRVGIFRMMEVMARHGVRGTVALNAEVCDDYPQIIEDARALDWEFMGHNQSNSRLLHLMAPEEERRVVLATFAS